MNYLDVYSSFLRGFVKPKRLISFVVDGGNGMTARVAANVFGGFPLLSVAYINDTPDGNFPAHGPNPLFAIATEELSRKVVEGKCDFGVVFDADGDRAIFVDDKGERISSHIIALFLFEEHEPPFVLDEYLFQAFTFIGRFDPSTMTVSAVGHAHMKEAMRRVKASIGAENSGHYYFSDFFRVESGLMALIKVLNALSFCEKPLSVYRASLPVEIFYSIDIPSAISLWEERKNFLLENCNKRHLSFSTDDGVSIHFGDSWLNVRPSHTEDRIRFMAGSRSLAKSKERVEEVEKILNF